MELCNISVIKSLLEKHGFRLSKSMGQNFLTADWVPERIAREAMLDKGTGVLEIGPGIGCLTAELSERAGKVLAVELDRRLEPVLKETLEGKNAEVVFGDILKIDLEKLVTEGLGGMRPCVCANLPYNITTPVITKLLESKLFDSLTLMIQREVAKRVCANPATSDYGAFTVFVRWHAQAEILFDVPPGCFMPAPKVTSSVIRITPRTAPVVDVKSEETFFSVVRAGFNQRRKTLVNALHSGLGMGLGKAELEALVVSCGLNPLIRAEALGIEEFARVADAVYRAKTGGQS